MTRRVLFVILVLGLGVSVGGAASPSARTWRGLVENQQNAEDEIKRVKEAATVLDEIMAAADQAVPRAVFEKAEGIAVFPSLIKAGLGIGGQRGRGIISVRDRKTGGWSAPAFLTITGGSIGAQFGVQAIDLVLVVNNQRGLEQLVQDRRGRGRGRGPGRARGQRVDRHPDARADSQLLALARVVRRRDAQRLDHQAGPRRQRALLRRRLPDRADRLRGQGHADRPHVAGRVAGDAGEVRQVDQSTAGAPER
jgi:hypothetical protein